MLNVLEQAKIIAKENQKNEEKLKLITEEIDKVDNNILTTFELYENLKIILEI